MACVMVLLLVLVGDKTGTTNDAHNRQAYLKYEDKHIYQLSELAGLGGYKVCPPNGSYQMIEFPNATERTLLATLCIQGDDFILRSIQGCIYIYDFQNGERWIFPESKSEVAINDDAILALYNPDGALVASLQFCRGVYKSFDQQEVKL